MSVFRHGEVQRQRRWGLRILLAIFSILFLLIGFFIFWFYQSISPIDASNEEQQIFTVNPGASEAAVSMQLEEQGLIKSALAFQIYARFSRSDGNLQAGGYKISKSMSISDIVEKMINGNVAVDLITILPAQRLDQIEETFKEAGFSEDEITNALLPGNYKDHPALMDKPEAASLEGYLYPESFNFSPTTPLEVIVRASLDQTDIALTPEIKSKFDQAGLSVHDGIILASIVEREVSNPDDRTKVAQVFLKRLREGLPLGSDPTALYGALLFGIEPSVSADTPYNTRLYEGLPPGPINNISAESLRAVAFPAETDYLFFVSGDDGKTYFSNTLADHEALTRQHCIELCKSY